MGSLSGQTEVQSIYLLMANARFSIRLLSHLHTVHNL